MIKLFSLMIRLGMDGSNFHQGLSQAQSAVQSFGRTLKASLAGAVSTGAMLALINNAKEYAGRINDISKRLQVSAEGLQEMEHAATQSGASVEDLTAAFRGLAKARAEALSGNPEKLQAFGLFGIDQSMLKAQTLEQTFKQIAGVVKSTNFGAGEMPALEAVLGKSAGTLIPMFRDGLEEATAEARKLGLIIREEVVNELDRMGDKAGVFQSRMRVIAAEAGSFFGKIGRNMLDAADIAVGGTGAMISGWIHGEKGGRLAQGEDNFVSHMNEVLDRRIREDQGNKPSPDGRTIGDATTGATASRVSSVEVDKVLSLRKRLHALAMDALPVEKKRADLLEKAKRLEGEIADLKDEQSKFGTERVREADILEKQIELQEANNAIAGLATKTGGHQFQLTQFQQAGAFSGLTAERAVALGPRVNSEDKQTASNTAQAVKILNEMNTKMRANGAGNGGFF